MTSFSNKKYYSSSPVLCRYLSDVVTIFLLRGVENGNDYSELRKTAVASLQQYLVN